VNRERSLHDVGDIGRGAGASGAPRPQARDDESIVKRAVVPILLVLLCFAVPRTRADRREEEASAAQEYGRVVMGNLPKGRRSRVEFDHWLHRAKFTCRLCTSTSHSP